MHAKTMLLVDHREAEIGEGDFILHQRMGADGDVDRAACEAFQCRAPFRRLVASGDQRDRQARGFGQRLDGGEMLAGEDFGRRHQRGLPPGLDGLRHGEQGDDRLARADIALQQPQHALVAGEIGGNFRHRFLLVAGQFEGQGGEDFCRQSPIADLRAPAKNLHFGAHQTQGELVRQKLVIGEPRPEFALTAKVLRL